MGIRVYRPVSKGRRNSSVSDFAEVTRGYPEKSLIEPLRKTGGRNNTGHITCRHIGGGNKRFYRKIDFRRRKDGIPARVESIEYDPNRSCRIALLLYQDGERRYILAPAELQVGDQILSGDRVDPKPGNTMPLRNLPLGMLIHNVELTPGRGGQLARSAGCSAQLLSREGDYAHILLPSGEIRKIHASCRATLGQLGNIEWSAITWGKAGRRRWMGIRPTVRGTAMNPVRHPMGGGEGRKGGGRHPCSPTGVLAKGGKTRRDRKPSSAFILRGRKKGRFQMT